MDIQAHTKLRDLLDLHPELEDKIMQIAPPFKNLKNPVLRKTVAKLATLEKVARIGNLDVTELVNKLRRETGQPEITVEQMPEIEWQEGDPAWIQNDPAHIIDGTEMLNRGEHPLNKVNALMREIKPGEFILLRTNFKPLPLIDEMIKQKYQVFSKPAKGQPDNHLTFIRNK